MSKYVIDDTTLSAIGNAIKAKKGDNTAITVSNFATEIANLSAGSSSSFTTTLLTDNSTTSQSNYRNTSVENIVQGDIDKIQSMIIKASQFIMVYAKDKHYQYLNTNMSNSNDNTKGTYLVGDILYYNVSYGTYTLYQYTGAAYMQSTFGFWLPNSDLTKMYEGFQENYYGNQRINLKAFSREGANNPLQIWITMED